MSRTLRQRTEPSFDWDACIAALKQWDRTDAAIAEASVTMARDVRALIEGETK